MKTPISGELDTTIAEDVKITVEYEYTDGLPVTANSPAEGPDITIHHVLVEGNDLFDALNVKAIAQIHDDICAHIAKYGD